MSFQYFPHRPTLLAVLSISALLLTACGGGGGGDSDPSGGGGGGGNNPGVVGISQTGSTNSHNDSRRGTDCMGCHTSGPGTGVFITSGTSIPAINGFVEYYADLARTDRRARLPVDAYGNFYTVTAIDILTANIPIGNGFASLGGYVTIVMSNGSRRNMPGSISHTTAACNFCHSGPGARSPL